MTGGSINIPIDISTEATTISIIKNGKNIKNPIVNAVFNSLITKAGITTYSGTLSFVKSVVSIFYVSTKSSKSFGLVCFIINSLKGFDPASIACS
ncbi:hypothetical protein SAMN02745941_01761 [Clostridium intestinale DSM 6191]|uniref:Uncharacterized protein n=1 Tax=Clostridium intestinale DSM 6191 TaxID=1121320 RepID=A0A1M5Y057_9CLOT|nr:hypothetical protein SAMN02745941_01761 [Clostridium intestinale DSM 6191]